MKPHTTFTVAERAPTAAEAYNGEIIPNQYGNIAIKGFIIDPLNPNSSLELDETVDPPVLKLKHVLASTIYGYTEKTSSEFIRHENEMNQSEHLVSGEYNGPNSILIIS